ncbi:MULTISPECIES: radical SAM protein [Thermococcus]|uniref:Biotin synthase-related protein, radical SAM superfamily n=1 Tax=Thermococcus sibiricus TaxID=172049 RepID=A0A124FFI1_9EURY|nr:MULTISPECIES: radical SAM protein [Thermococcus]KUK18171.1 MAG: Biotin synthase-related protein, radical SAM superfamily [Thermococcus sibiricus]KUK29213.1 MAG: Biotin synthase-related protein, radical SAM superfamily [Thermococcus sp. 40_45]MBC7095235.1 radical SAM protein [Thermococcus sp.]HII68099.1 radical SAM protein [Thermococcaceae archaeon]
MKKLKIYIPGISFPSLSLTGNYCTLDCAHCGKHYLESMKKVEKSNLVDYCKNLEKEGYKGCLLSGGMDSRLKVPLDIYTDEIKQIKKETKLKLNVHVGFIDESDLEWLKYVDVVSLDFVGEDDVIKRVYKIKKRVEDYLKIIELLTSNGIKVAPHITVGLDFGKIWWEYKAIELLAHYPVDVLVLDVLIPTRGTEMENTTSPSVDKSLEVVKYARDTFNGELSIGCMRPPGKWRLEFDKGAILIGVDRITNPPRKVIEWAKKIRDVEIIYECCVI